jgi:hypothetical protein
MGSPVPVCVLNPKTICLLVANIHVDTPKGGRWGSGLSQRWSANGEGQKEAKMGGNEEKGGK